MFNNFKDSEEMEKQSEDPTIQLVGEIRTKLAEQGIAFEIPKVIKLNSKKAGKLARSQFEMDNNLNPELRQIGDKIE